MVPSTDGTSSLGDHRVVRSDRLHRGRRRLATTGAGLRRRPLIRIVDPRRTHRLGVVTVASDEWVSVMGPRFGHTPRIRSETVWPRSSWIRSISGSKPATRPRATARSGSATSRPYPRRRGVSMPIRMGSLCGFARAPTYTSRSVVGWPGRSIGPAHTTTRAHPKQC